MEKTHGFDDAFSCEPPRFLPENLKKQLHFLSCLRESKNRSVYLVKYNDTGEKAVLKITEKTSADSAKSESIILSALNHPHIPRCIFFMEDKEGREYLLRSYKEGDVLGQLLERDGVFDEERILDIVVKICSILHYLHKQQPPIIYRDINPNNITLTANGIISLFDFGISEKIEIKDKDKPFNTVLVGAIPFISPEQMGFGRTDRRSDIFAIGKLMVYLKSGQTDLGTFFKSNPQTNFGRIVEKCTKQAKEKRFSSIRQLEKYIKKTQKKPTRQAFIKGAVLMTIFLIFGFLLFSYTYIMKEDVTIYPQKKDVSIGIVDSDLPINWPELIVAVRKTLQISSQVNLTKEMLDKVNHIEIIEENLVEGISDIGYIKKMVTTKNLLELQYFKNLTSLSLQGVVIESLEPISEIPLKSLNLSRSIVGTISSINKMVSLTSLDLSHTTVDDIHPLVGLSNLSTLDLSNTYIRDISSLEFLYKLTDVSLQATRVTDFSPIRNLTNIKKLRITHVQIKDFSFLNNLHNLTHLELRSTGFWDLEMIESKNIEVLDVSLNYNYLKDISTINKFKHLRELDISRTQIQNYGDISALSELKTLGIDESQLFLLTKNADKLLFLEKIILTAEEIPPDLKIFAKKSGALILLRTYYDTN